MGIPISFRPIGLGIFLFSLFLVAATPAARPSGSDTGTPTITGADRDAHGCVASAGYTWSQLRKTCIRLFEDGMALHNVQDPTATDVAYLIGGAADAPLELFLPDNPHGIMMSYHGGRWHDSAGSYAVTGDDRAGFEVQDAKGDLLYSSEAQKR